MLTRLAAAALAVAAVAAPASANGIPCGRLVCDLLAFQCTWEAQAVCDVRDTANGLPWPCVPRYLPC